MKISLLAAQIAELAWPFLLQYSIAKREQNITNLYQHYFIPLLWTQSKICYSLDFNKKLQLKSYCFAPSHLSICFIEVYCGLCRPWLALNLKQNLGLFQCGPEDRFFCFNITRFTVETQGNVSLQANTEIKAANCSKDLSHFNLLACLL